MNQKLDYIIQKFLQNINIISLKLQNYTQTMSLQ